MPQNNSIVTRLIDKIKNNKKFQYIIVVLLIVLGVITLLFSYKTEQVGVEAQDVIENYVADLENRLSNALSEVDGAGKVVVLITVESGMETVLAMKTTEKQTANGVEIETTPIVINGKTVVLKETYPKIIGVLIVAQGADKISVRNKIQQATISLLDINVNQIEILSMK